MSCRVCAKPVRCAFCASEGKLQNVKINGHMYTIVCLFCGGVHNYCLEIERQAVDNYLDGMPSFNGQECDDHDNRAALGDSD